MAVIDKEKSREIFSNLNKIDLSSMVEKKMDLTYLSWAKAWGILKTYYPDSDYTIYKRHVDTTEVVVEKDDSLGRTKTTTSTYQQDIPYFTDGKTCYVKVGVTIEGIEYVEELPIMDNRGNAVRYESVTSTLVNKTCYRAFVKACAKHGLGLYIYAGEDLPQSKRVTAKDMKDAIAFAKSAKVENNNVTEESFNKLKNDIINKIKEEESNPIWNAAVKDLFYSFVAETVGKKLSETTINDVDSLIKIQLVYNKLEENSN